MRIMQVIQDLRVGGAERSAVTLSNGLSKRGHDVLLVALRGGGAQQVLLNRDRGLQLEILEIGRHSIANPIAFLHELHRTTENLSRLFREFRPDIVQSHLPEDSLLVDRCVRRNRIGRHVPVVHSQRFHLHRQRFDLRSRLRLRLFARVVKRAARTVAVSGAVRQRVIELTRIDPGCVAVLHNGADLEAFKVLASRTALRASLDLPIDRRIVMAVGRLDRAKNYPLLVQASASMLLRFPDTLFVVAGEGPERSRVEAEICKLGVERSWILLGQRMDVPECLGAADLFAMSSAWEGFPVAIIEAMAAGLPIVATNVAGVAEVIDHEYNGLLVENGSARQLSEALCRLANDAAFARQLGRKARRLALSEYDLETYIDRVEALLMRVASSP